MSTSNETADDAPAIPRAPVPVPGVLLVWSAGAPAYRAIRLDGGTVPTSFGRARACDVPLSDDTALSRRHLTFAVDGDDIVVRDEGSRNGTFFNANALSGVHRSPLRERGVVRAGGSVFLVEPDLHRVGVNAGNPSNPNARTTLREGDSIIGPEMVRVRQAVVDAAQRERSLLIHGETGTGKERMARLFHAGGPHARGPFVDRNCAGLDRALAEAQLFGAVRGAFTGAHRNLAGAFELADGGVLFLDEVGELALDVQPKLLRVLQEGTILPVGGALKKVAVPLVCATHRDLPARVASGHFRQDLYARIVQRVVHLPPLHDRLEEIPFLVEMFRARAHGAPPASARFIETCLLHPWPNNLRDLEMAVERSASFAAANADALVEPDRELFPELVAAPLERSTIPSDLPPARSPTPTPAPAPVRPSVDAMPRTKREAKRAALLAALAAHDGDVAAAAASLGMGVSNAYAMLARMRDE